MRTENGRSEEEVVAATPTRSETLRSPRASHRCPPPLRHEASFTPTVHQQRSLEREIPRVRRHQRHAPPPQTVTPSRRIDPQSCRRVCLLKIETDGGRNQHQARAALAAAAAAGANLMMHECRRVIKRQQMTVEKRQIAHVI